MTGTPEPVDQARQRSGPPPFSARRLLLVGTGSVGVAFLPFWVNWLRSSYPELEIRPVVTRAALRFVTLDALSGLAGTPAVPDAWPDGPTTTALHVELAEWADTVLVYPATLHYLGRLATGLADTPSLLALQCTSAVIGLAAGLPPGGWESPAMRQHRAALARRPNVVVAPPEPGRSITTGRTDAETPVPMSLLVAMVERHRRQQASPGNG
ncbi:flavoprotein [Micromonospora sp. NPDC048170]|uniref:flavoprotein n=1 Tax=Micromonospora sp. NPDC048170 TaxID=3154819 RepID=UPI0033E50506